MKQILLIYLGVKVEKEPNFPIPLLYLSKVLLEHEFEVDIWDTRIKPIELCDYSSYKVVGISVMTVFYAYAQKITRMIRQRNNECSIVWGGHHPTLIPRETLLENPAIDYLVCGEGEIAFLELCEVLIHGKEKDASQIPGVAMRKGEEIILNEGNLAVELNEMWELPYHLVLREEYPKSSQRFEMYTSRGCPHSCAFCSNSMHESRWRGKTPEVMIAEVMHIKKLFSPKMISIFDANFFVNKERVRQFCKILIQKKINMRFYAMGRCDYFSRYDDDFLELLREAGFREIAMGAESGSARMLRYFNKGFSPQEIIKSVVRTAAFNIKPILSFVVAAPGETERDLMETLNLYDEIIKQGGFVNGIFIFVPYPGSKITEEILASYPRIRLKDYYTKSLYDIKNCGFHHASYEKKCQAVAYCAHLFFVHSVRRHWSWTRKLLRDKYWYKVVINDILDCLFLVLARVRWKYRFFTWAYDLRLYWVLRNKHL